MMVSILVVDDDDVTARFLVSLFRAEDFSVAQASDAEAAVSYALLLTPDAIVGSMALPHPDGGDVLEALRRHPSLEGVAVVVVSDRDDEDEIVMRLESGADDYVIKPFNPRELVARVKKRLAPYEAPT